ncbi:MAG: TA system VapC family ribonuclease toxin [Candidatus Rokuibacteriota bacterium]
MVALLDVNVLVALFDPVHVHHEAAHEWFGAHRDLGWASCPITENGVVRVVSSPAYPGRKTTVADAARRLAVLQQAGDHVFWSDVISVCDEERFDLERAGGSSQLTDVYLLGLSVQHQGRLVTFDRGIPTAAVSGAEERHLVVLPA